MANYPELEKHGTIRYYGNSDLIGQIADELNRNPESCFSINVMNWYNELYSSGGLDTTCEYQLQIDQDKCEASEPTTLAEVVDVLLGFVQGFNRRRARAAIRIICRAALAALGRQEGAEN